MGPKSCRRVRTDLSNTVHTAWWGEGEGKGEGWLVNKASTAEISTHATLPLYLDHLRVIQPPAEEGLDQGERLLQHDEHLEVKLFEGQFTCPPQTGPVGTIPAAPTGFCVYWEGATVWLDAPSKLSACLLTSSVVKRLDSIPRMWMMVCLLAGLGCKRRRGEPEEHVVPKMSMLFCPSLPPPWPKYPAAAREEI